MTQQQLMHRLKSLPLPLQSLCTVIIAHLESLDTATASDLIIATDKALTLFESGDATKFLTPSQLEDLTNHPEYIHLFFHDLPDVVEGLACTEVSNEFSRLFKYKYSF